MKDRKFGDPPICHPDRKHEGLGMCKECYQKHINEKKREERKSYRLANPLPPRKKNPLTYYQRNKEKLLKKAKDLNISRYGITREEYDKMLDEQGGVCAICERPPKTHSLNIDHEHQPKEKTRSPESRRPRIRGLLCHRCNRALGLFGNDSQKLLLASSNFSKYISKYYAKRLVDKFGIDEAKKNMNWAIKYLESFEVRKPR